MSEKGAGCMACGLALMALVFPALVFAAASILASDWKVGLAAGLITFMVLSAGALFAASRMKDPSWPLVLAPAGAGLLYVVFPDLLPVIPVDDAAVLTGGLLTSLGLAIKKDPSLPRWPVIPILACGVYTLVGALIPGPVDEILFYTLVTIPTIAQIVAKRGAAASPPESGPTTKSLPDRLGPEARDSTVIDV